MSILSTSPAKSFLSRKKHSSQPDIHISQQPTQQFYTSNDINTKDFCNSFWGVDSNGYGFDTLTNKLKSSSKTVDDLKLFWKERSAIEDEYARKMAKLSRFLVGTGETGAVRDSLDTLSTELEQTSQNHFNLCQTIHRDLERPTNEWSIRLSNLKKSSLATIEKKYKVLQTQESYVDKVRLVSSFMQSTHFFLRLKLNILTIAFLSTLSPHKSLSYKAKTLIELTLNSRKLKVLLALMSVTIKTLLKHFLILVSVGKLTGVCFAIYARMKKKRG